MAVGTSLARERFHVRPGSGVGTVEIIPHLLKDKLSGNIEQPLDCKWLFQMGVRAGFPGEDSNVLFR